LITVLVLLKTGAAIGGGILIRALARARVEGRKRRELTEPLIDRVRLETYFVPEPGDDPNLVAEVRDTIAHLNRQAWAEEFYSLPEQLAALDNGLPKAAKATLRRLMARLIRSDDRWLILVGARTLMRLDAKAAEGEIGETVKGLREKPDATDADRGLAAELERIAAGDDAVTSPAA